MNLTYRLVGTQYKRAADILSTLGLAALIGGAGDAIVNDLRPGLNRAGIVSGAFLLALSIHLSRWERPSRRGRARLTHFERRR